MSWHTTPSGKTRLAREIQAVRARFGSAAVLDRAGNYSWRYTIRRHGRALPIRIEYPAGYPNDAPNVYAECPMPDGTPHRYSNKMLCWRDYGSSSWNPAHNTVVNVILRMHQWLDNFLVWQVKGIWPSDHIARR